MAIGIQRISPTNTNPRYHASLYDPQSGNIAGMLLCDPDGEPFTDGEKAFPVAVFPLEQRGIQTFNTVSDLDSRAYPYMTISQQDFSGGRGGLWFEDDKSKFKDSYSADTVSSNIGVMPHLQPSLTSGGTSSPTNGNLIDFTCDCAGKFGLAQQPRFGTGNDATIHRELTSTSAGVGGFAYTAIRFVATASYDPEAVYFYLSRSHLTSMPGQIQIGIAPDNANKPDLTGVAFTGVIPQANMSPSYDTSLPPDVPQLVGVSGMAGIFGSLTSGNTYWVVVYTAATSSSVYWIMPTMEGASGCKANGWCTVSENGTTWYELENQPWIAVKAKAGAVNSGFEWGKFFNHRGGLYYLGAGASGNQLMQNGDRGRVTAYSFGDITDSTKSWVTDQWKGAYLQILPNSYAGNHNAPHRGFYKVYSNTATVLTVEQYNTIPVGAEYVILGASTWTDRKPGTYTAPSGNFVSSVAQSDRYTWFAGGEGTNKVWGYGDWINASGSVETFQAELAGLHASHIATVWDEGIGDWALYGLNHSSNAEVLKNNIWKVHVPRYKMIGYTATTNVYPIHKEAKIIAEDDLYNDGVAGQHANVTYNVLANDVTPSAIKSTNDANHHHFQLNASHGANVIAWRNLSQSTDFSPFDMMSYDIQVDRAVSSGQLAFCVSDVENLGFGTRTPTWVGIKAYATLDVAPTYTDWSYNLLDGSTATYIKTGTWVTTNSILICAAEPFNKITITVDGTAKNTVAATTWAGYYDDSSKTWTAFGSLVDGTATAGVPLDKTGDITYTSPAYSDWQPTTINGVTGYWVSISYNAVLTANVELEEITVSHNAGRYLDVAIPHAISTAGDRISVVAPTAFPEQDFNDIIDIRNIKSVGWRVVTTFGAVTTNIELYHGVWLGKAYKSIKPPVDSMPASGMIAYPSSVGTNRMNPHMFYPGVGWFEIQADNGDVVVPIPVKEFEGLMGDTFPKTISQQDVYLLFGQGNSLERYYQRTIEDFGVDRDGLPEDRRGYVTGLRSSPGRLWVLNQAWNIDDVYNNYDARSSLWLYHSGGWHEMHTLWSTSTVQDVGVISLPGTEKSLVFFVDGGMIWQMEHHPNADNEATLIYKPNAVIDTGWIHGGFETLEKSWKKVTIGLDPGQIVSYKPRVYYQEEGWDVNTWVALTSVTVSGDSQQEFWFDSTSKPVNAKSIRLRIVINGNNEFRGRVAMKWWTIDAYAIDPTKYGYRMNFVVGDPKAGMTLLSGQREVLSMGYFTAVEDAVAQLNDWVNTGAPLLLETIWSVIPMGAAMKTAGYQTNDTYVRMLPFTYRPVTTSPRGQIEKLVIDATFVEI